jgi:ubiquinone/menaquinone biosynthesis C-methylase UbiE
MGWYSEVVFPRLCNLALGTADVAERRKSLLAHAAGDVLEIGFGTGLNLPFYPRPVRRLAAVDPNPGMSRLARRRHSASSIDITHHLADGEALPFDEQSFDCVVSTFTLCSVPDPARAMQEVFRVLKKEGRFLVLEHGESPDPLVLKWQRRLNWLQKRLAGGCHLDRPITALVSGQPFSAVQVEHSYSPGQPKTHGSLYSGTAMK